MEQKAPRNVYWCYALNSYAERFNVEKVSDEVRVNWKGRATTIQVFNVSTERAAELIVDRQVNFRAHRTSLKWQFES